MTQPPADGNIWLRCSACRKAIAFGATHWICSVSTCNRTRTRLVFCSVPCWDSHLAMLRHREAWAVEERAPSRAEWEAELAAQKELPAPAAATTATTATPAELAEVADRDILVVVSKMKKYIKDRSGMNCGDAVAQVLSDHVRALCNEAIRAAAQEGRKTVLERDLPRPRR
jgi:hypothetical protein